MKAQQASHDHFYGSLKLPKINALKKAKLKSTSRVLAYVFISSVLIFFTLNLLLYLFYPSDKAMPNIKVGAMDVGKLNKQQIIEKLSQLNSDLEVEIKDEFNQEKISLKSLGLELDVQATADAALAHRNPKYLPTVGLWAAINSEPVQIIFSKDEDKLNQGVEQALSSFDKGAQNAELVFSSEGKLLVKPATAGRDYSQQFITKQILSNLSASNQVVAIKSDIVQPKISTQMAETQLESYQQYLNSKFDVNFNGTTNNPSQQQRAGWVKVDNRPKEDVIEVSIDKFKIAAYVTQFANKVDTPPVNTVVNNVNGLEVSRKDGKDGLAINRDEAVNMIAIALDKDSGGTVDVPTMVTKPQVIHNNSYSKNNLGLTTLVNDWVKTQNADYGIIIQELGGESRLASHQPDKAFVTASTYKMFLAYVVLSEIDSGEIKLSDKSGLSGWTVGACIQEMIRNSTNPCAIALGDKVGWAKATTQIKNAGFASTDINNYINGQLSGNKWSTARDEANFLIKLNAGELLSPTNTNLLLSHMKLQKFKNAIPAGLSPGVISADKVGFWGTYRHDVAIVYAPSGTYILTVMSQWGTEYSISTLSKEVYKYFAQ